LETVALRGLPEKSPAKEAEQLPDWSQKKLGEPAGRWLFLKSE